VIALKNTFSGGVPTQAAPSDSPGTWSSLVAPAAMGPRRRRVGFRRRHRRGCHRQRQQVVGVRRSLLDRDARLRPRRYDVQHQAGQVVARHSVGDAPRYPVRRGQGQAGGRRQRHR
jgi:hypothetical protein